MSPAIVKLGGSSASSTDLPCWLAAIEAATQPLVLVPGGGPFADAVRDSQFTLGFSDAAAHAMALLAMEQFGLALIDRAKRLWPARGLDDIRAGLDDGKIPVWLPSSLALGARDIPTSWDVTSDSLAAWLAGRLEAHALLLIKQTDDFSAADTFATLTARGIVDAAFGNFPLSPTTLHLAGPRHLGAAAAAFAEGRLPGEFIAPGDGMRKAG